MDEHNIDRNKRKKGVKSVIWQCERIKKARIKGGEYVNYEGNGIKLQVSKLNLKTVNNIFKRGIPF